MEMKREEAELRYESLKEEYEMMKLEFGVFKSMRRRDVHDNAAVKLLEDKLNGKEREITTLVRSYT